MPDLLTEGDARRSHAGEVRRGRLPFDPIPRIWDGTTVFVIGGGPSLRGFDYERLRERHVLAINAAAYDLPWAEALFFNDNSFFEQHGAAVRDFRGVRITTSRRAKEAWPEGLIRPEPRPGNAFSRDPLWVRAGRSSGHTALNVASLLGARTAVLLGFDCRQAADGRMHGHDHYPPHRHEIEADYAGDFLPHWRGMGEMARSAGLAVLNATPGSAITEFMVFLLGEDL